MLPNCQDIVLLFICYRFFKKKEEVNKWLFKKDEIFSNNSFSYMFKLF